jgi:hypothetical protein
LLTGLLAYWLALTEQKKWQKNLKTSELDLIFCEFELRVEWNECSTDERYAFGTKRGG